MQDVSPSGVLADVTDMKQIKEVTAGKRVRVWIGNKNKRPVISHPAFDHVPGKEPTVWP